MASGTRTSGRSRSVAKASIRRRSCCADSRRRGRSFEGSLGVKREAAGPPIGTLTPTAGASERLASLRECDQPWALAGLWSIEVGLFSSRARRRSRVRSRPRPATVLTARRPTPHTCLRRCCGRQAAPISFCITSVPFLALLRRFWFATFSLPPSTLGCGQSPLCERPQVLPTIKDGDASARAAPSGCEEI